MKVITYSTMANTYLVIDEETKKGFIVDPGAYYAELSGRVIDEGADIMYIILTHGHADHIGGVESYRNDFPGVKVVAAEAERQMLLDPEANLSLEITGDAVSIEADIYVKEGDHLTVGNMEIKFAMTPGHTKGGMCILAGKAVFSGDTLFQCSVGRTDFPGGSYEDIISSIKEKLMTLDDDVKVFPGHMGTTTIGFERENNPFV